MEIRWIKITTDIFDDEKIKLIDSFPDRDAIIVIWFKLLTLAGKKNNNGLIFLSNKLAYTDEMLATIFNRPLNTIRLAIKTFTDLDMIEVNHDNIIAVVNWEKHQNIEGLEKIREQNRIRKQKQRESLKLTLETGSHVTSRDSHATDKNKNKNKIKNKSNIRGEKLNFSCTLSERKITALKEFENYRENDKKIKLTQRSLDTIIKRIEEFSDDEVEEAVQVAISANYQGLFPKHKTCSQQKKRHSTETSNLGVDDYEGRSI